MTYEKQDWVNGDGGGTPLSAARLNHMEDGIEAAYPSDIPPLWPAIAASRMTAPLTIVAMGDSRGEGIDSGFDEGATSWQNTWPCQVARRMRVHFGMSEKGATWLPLKRTDDNEWYHFPSPTLQAGDWSPLNDVTGVAGSQWMVPVSEGGQRIRVPISSGATSASVITSGAAGPHHVKITKQSGGSEVFANEVGGPIYENSVTSPGTYIDVESDAWGLQALGAIEYFGDEDAGIRIINLSQSGASAHALAARASQDVFGELMEFLDAKIVLVGAGANDVVVETTTLSEFTDDINTLTGIAPLSVAVTAVETSAFPSPRWDLVQDGVRQSNHTWLLDLSARGIDTDPNWQGCFISDHTHLSNAGNAAFADATARVMTRDV